MDRTWTDRDPDGRGLLSLALAAAAAVAAAAFGRVFEGSSLATRLVLVAAGAVLLGFLLERRHLILSVAASAFALLAVVGVLVFPQTTFLGFLPTRATAEALVAALGNLGRHATEQATPVPAFPSLVSASVIAVWSAAYASHALAARAHSPMLALVPTATLLAFAEVVVEDAPRPGYAAAFLVAAGAVLFASGVRRLRSWGPVLPRRSFPAFRLAGGSLGRSAQRLGLAATAVALVVPGLLPGYEDDALVDLEAGGSRVSISPLVDIRPNLLRDPAIELFRVRANRASYWRLLSLDRYSGRFWSSTDPRASQGTSVSASTGLGGEGGGPEALVLDQEIRVVNLAGPWLPAAHVPVAVAVAGRSVRYDPDAAVLVDEDGVPRNLEYRVRSEAVVPSPEQLDRTFDFGAAGVPDKYFELPSETPPEVAEYARGITRGVRTPYRRALAIQNHLRTFSYDEKAPAGHGIDDLVHFLQIRRGYCEQFAGTMAVLLRSLGYPARVAVGFLPGEPDEDGVFHVTTDEAHSWVEMFFPGHGWLAFEPTPTRNDPVGAPYQITGTEAFSPEALGPGPGLSAQQEGAGGRPRAQRQAFELRSGGGVVFDTGGDGAPARGRPWWITAGLILLVLAAAGALLLPPATSGLRRLRLRRAAAPGTRVLAAYELFSLRALDVGLGRRPGETPWEHRDRLRAALALSDGHLERLTAITTRVLYGGATPTPSEAERAVAATRALGTNLRRHAGWLRSWTGTLRSSSPGRRVGGD